MPFATNGLDGNLPLPPCHVLDVLSSGIVSFAAGLASSAAVIAAVNYVHHKQDEDCKTSIKQRLSSRIQKILEEKNGECRVIEVLIDEREKLHGLLKERRNEISTLQDELAEVMQQRTVWWERYIDAASMVKALVEKEKANVHVHVQASLGTQTDFAANRRAGDLSAVENLSTTKEQSSQTEGEETSARPSHAKKPCAPLLALKISCQKDSAKSRPPRGNSHVSLCKSKVGCPRRRCSRRPVDAMIATKYSIPASPSCKGDGENNALVLQNHLSSRGKPAQAMLPMLDDMLQGGFGLGVHVVGPDALGPWSWLAALSAEREGMSVDLNVGWMPIMDDQLQDDVSEWSSSSWKSKAMLLLGTALAVQGAIGGARGGARGLALRGRDICFMPRRSQLEARLMRFASTAHKSAEALESVHGLVKDTHAGDRRVRAMKLASLIL
eukprot:763318-Hanusia_phi.AAC.10